MSPPRRHYGPKPPGRLSATLLKVVAAELTDGGRLGRGKRYFNDGAVTDIEISPGMCVVAVQGGRATPYEVRLLVGPGDGVPSASELGADCDCIDASRGSFCKHAVAAVFAVANEIAVEPDQLALWRSGGETTRHQPADHHEDVVDDDDDGDSDGLADVIPLFSAHRSLDDRSPADDVVDDHDGRVAAEINTMLTPAHQSGNRVGNTQEIVDIGELESAPTPPSGDATVDRLIESALAEFDLGWH